MVFPENLSDKKKECQNARDILTFKILFQYSIIFSLP